MASVAEEIPYEPDVDLVDRAIAIGHVPDTLHQPKFLGNHCGGIGLVRDDGLSGNSRLAVRWVRNGLSALGFISVQLTR